MSSFIESGQLRQPDGAVSRRGMVAGGIGAGILTVVLPSAADAASVGGAGGGSPSYLNTTTFTPDPTAYGRPAAGFWGGVPPDPWRFHIDLSQWNLPAPDTGKTTVNTLVNTYEISPNNQQSWHQLSLIPSVPGGSPPRFFGVFVPRSQIPGELYVTSTAPFGMTWIKTNEGADGMWDWITSAYLRVKNPSGTIIDLAGPFWLW